MDESNRKATLNVIWLLTLAITWTLLSDPGICQEPRKPSWMPFPMGRAAERAIPKTTPVAKPDEKIIASPAIAQDPNRPDPWLLWADLMRFKFLCGWLRDSKGMALVLA